MSEVEGRMSGGREPGERRGAVPAPVGAYRDGRNGLPGEISLVRLLNVLLRHRRVVLGLSAGAALLAVVITLILPRTYTAETSFLPQAAERDVSRLAGLAAQFGFSLPGTRTGEVPQFYADLLRSRELLQATVHGPYDLGTARGNPEGSPASLVDYYRLAHRPSAKAVDRAIERLRDDLRIRTRSETGVVELAVTTRSPDLSYQVASRMLELVNTFNLERRQSQAAAERSFIDERLRAAEDELQAAEDSLKAFLQQNRRYENSPELVFEFDRLERRVALRQQVFTSLAESFEQARIEEVRNTPVITVVDGPEPPPRPDRRWLALKGTIGLFLGGMLGIFWAFGREFLTAAREEEPDDYAELERLKGEATGDFRAAWRRLRRPTSTGSRAD